MNAVITLLMGAVVGLGIFVVVAAQRGARGLSRILGSAGSSVQLRPIMLLIPAAFLVAFIVTGWIVIGAAAAAVMASTPGVGRRSVKQRDEQAIVEAIASWTEQLRDTLAGAHGLEQAIVATAKHAPQPIVQAVERLAAFMAYGSLQDGLRRFAEEVDHPTADFVVAALVTATQHQARDLGVLLGHVAQCARDESRMRSRVWVGRARTRSAVRIITGVVSAFVGGLFIFNRAYLDPYTSIQGQFILSCILVMFATAIVLMHSMSHIQAPERFIRRRLAVVR
ncbi:MAG: pilus assembly protein TadB [Actinobacteria bacterium]|uniref:Unannotated protein n=1 Tax=freshwater metagenome TaxID=449393 RepID=A0A6J7N490_9ZZZZ|nr:pilus assembly protein TadB [Actinomycetota bacterium]